MPKNDLLNSSILKSLFDTDILAGGARPIGNRRYTATGDRLIFICSLILIHIIGAINVAKITDLSSSASSVILGMYGGYVGGFFLVLMLIYIIATGKRRLNTLLRWKWVIVILIFILLVLAIVAMAMSNMGSSSDKGYSYSSVILLYISIIFLIWYSVRMQIKLVPSSSGDQGAIFQTNNSSNFVDPNNPSVSSEGANYGSGQGQGQNW